MPDPFVVQVARALAALRPPARLLAAVSGGADSVAMLDALARARYRRDLRALSLVVGHVDHGLRADSALDREIARRHAQRLGLPFASAAVQVRPRGGGLEEQAREARYGALSALAREHGCEGVVMGHTATDQAETLLWRLVRGAGAHGLAAMAARRELDGLALLRPLLGVAREQTRAWCAKAGLEFRDDPTNLDERPRARLRAEVLPALERLAPGAALRLAAAAARLRADDEVLEGLAAGADDDATALAALPGPVRARALARWFEAQAGSRRRLTAAHLAALEGLVLAGRGEVELPSPPGRRRRARLLAGRLVVSEKVRPGGSRGRPPPGAE